MRKIAVFAEGATEIAFAKKIFLESANSAKIQIEHQKQFRGSLVKIAITTAAHPPEELFLLLADCCQDGQVLTQIRDRYSDLVAAGYTDIIGLRDLYPDFSAGDLPRIKQSVAKILPVGTVPVTMCYAVVETEAWFLDEHTHFSRVHPKLTLARIGASGIDIKNVVGEAWPHPAATLHDIYRLEGLAYKKRGKQIRRTVTAISSANMRRVGRGRSPSLDHFLHAVDAALSR